MNTAHIAHTSSTAFAYVLTISRRRMASWVSSVDGLRVAVTDGIARCDSMANRLDALFWWASSRPLRLFGSGGRPGNDILRETIVNTQAVY